MWPAVGGSILLAIFNGGPPGVIYEFIVVSVFYWIIAASLAELASAIPSSAGVYHWASVTPGAKWGRVVGYALGDTSFVLAADVYGQFLCRLLELAGMGVRCGIYEFHSWCV